MERRCGTEVVRDFSLEYGAGQGFGSRAFGAPPRARIAIGLDPPLLMVWRALVAFALLHRLAPCSCEEDPRACLAQAAKAKALQGPKVLENSRAESQQGQDPKGNQSTVVPPRITSAQENYGSFYVGMPFLWDLDGMECREMLYMQNEMAGLPSQKIKICSERKEQGGSAGRGKEENSLEPIRFTRGAAQSTMGDYNTTDEGADQDSATGPRQAAQGGRQCSGIQRTFVYREPNQGPTSCADKERGINFESQHEECVGEAHGGVFCRGTHRPTTLPCIQDRKYPQGTTQNQREDRRSRSGMEELRIHSDEKVRISERRILSNKTRIDECIQDQTRAVQPGGRGGQSQGSSGEEAGDGKCRECRHRATTLDSGLDRTPSSTRYDRAGRSTRRHECENPTSETQEGNRWGGRTRKVATHTERLEKKANEPTGMEDPIELPFLADKEDFGLYFAPQFKAALTDFCFWKVTKASDLKRGRNDVGHGRNSIDARNNSVACRAYEYEQDVIQSATILKAIFDDLLPRAKSTSSNFPRRDVSGALNDHVAGMLNGTAWEKGELQIYWMCGMIITRATFDLMNWMIGRNVIILVFGILMAFVGLGIHEIIKVIKNRHCTGYESWSGIVQGRRCVGRRWKRTPLIKLSHVLMIGLVVSAECHGSLRTGDSLQRNLGATEENFSFSSSYQHPQSTENGMFEGKHEMDGMMLMQRTQNEWPRWYGPEALDVHDDKSIKAKVWKVTGRRNAYMNPQMRWESTSLRRDGRYHEQLQDLSGIRQMFGDAFDLLPVHCSRDIFDHHQHREDILAVDQGHEFQWKFVPMLGDFHGINFRFRAAAMIPKPEQTITILLLFDIYHEWHDCEGAHHCVAQIDGELHEVHDEIFSIPGNYAKLVMTLREEGERESGDSESCSTRASNSSSDNLQGYETRINDQTLAPASSDEENEYEQPHRKENGHPEDHDYHSLFQQFQGGVLTRSHSPSYEFWDKGHVKLSERTISNGRHPDEVHSASGLGQRIQRTALEWNFWRLNLRGEADRFTQIQGQQEIVNKFLELAEMRDDRNVRLHLHGLGERELRVEKVWIDTEQIQDTLDLLVIMRRMWMEDAATPEMHLYYVSPQPPAAAYRDTQVITLIMDIRPMIHTVPILVVTRFNQQGFQDTYDIVSYRHDPLINCRQIKEITGLLMVCEHNARCVCTFDHNRVDEEHLMPFRGGEMFIVHIYFDLCRSDLGPTSWEGNHQRHQEDEQLDDEVTNMMQVLGQRVNQPFEMPWLYGYGLGVQEPARAWRYGAGGIPAGPYLATIYARQVGNILHQHVTHYRVLPQPTDIIRMSGEAFVLAAQEEVKPWNRLILLDANWDTKHLWSWEPTCGERKRSGKQG